MKEKDPFRSVRIPIVFMYADYFQGNNPLMIGIHLCLMIPMA